MTKDQKPDSEYRDILMTVIILIATLSGLGLIFNILISPVKADVAILKADVATLKEDVAVIKTAVLKK